MVQTISSRTVTLGELGNAFNLRLIEDSQFFREWQDDLPLLTVEEQRQFDRVKANYANLVSS